MKTSRKESIHFPSSQLILWSIFTFLFSCSHPPKPLAKKKVLYNRTLPLSLEIEKEVSRFLIQEPDQELSVKLFKLKKGKDRLISHQKIKGLKIPSVIRLKVREDKNDRKNGPIYTVVIRLRVNSKDRFKGLLIIPHWRSTWKPLRISLRKY